jgi:hypothetical protein
MSIDALKRLHRPLVSVYGCAVAGALMGLLVYLFLFGPRGLDPNDTSWVETGDPATMFLGLHFFRHEPWSWPPGRIEGYGPSPTSVVYTDSIPVAAMTVKALAATVSGPINYFGIWAALGYALMGGFFGLVAGILAGPGWPPVLAAGLVASLPFVAWRVGGHFALVAQWMLVAALLLSVSSRVRGKAWLWASLLAIAVATHAYLAAMVAAIWVVDLASRLIVEKCLRPLAGAIELCIVGISAISAAFIAGYFVVGGGQSVGGYGFFALNLWAPFNARGSGLFLNRFSVDLPDGGDGYLYLGAGNLLVIAFASIVAVMRPPMRASILPWIPAFVACTLLTLFAVSPYVRIGHRQLLHVPVPDWLLDAAGIFRSSSRMAWPMVYLVLLLACVFIVRRLGAKRATMLFAVCGVVQAVDLIPLRRSAHQAFDRMVADRNSSAPDLAPVLRGYDRLEFVPAVRIDGANIRTYFPYLYAAGTSGMMVNSAYTARFDERIWQDKRRRQLQERMASAPRPDTAYLVVNAAVLHAMASHLSPHDHLIETPIGTLVLSNARQEAPGVPATSQEIEHIVRRDTRVVKWAVPLRFDDAAMSREYLLDGFSHNEPWGFWTDGDDASLAFMFTSDGKASDARLRLSAVVNSVDGPQSVSVRVNNVDVGTVQRAASSLPVDLDFHVPEGILMRDGGAVRVDIHIGAPSPPRVKGVADTRRLGVGLTELRLDPVAEGLR